MKKYTKILSIIFALVVIIGSISFSGIAFSEDVDDTQVEVNLDEQSEEIDEEDDLVEPPTDNNGVIEEVNDDEVNDDEVNGNEENKAVEEVTNELENSILANPENNVEKITNIMTTDSNNQKVNENVGYNHISEVYIRVEGHKDEGPYKLKFFVYGPGNNELISDTDPVLRVVDNGDYPQLIAMTNVQPTNNPGGVYRVVVEQYDDEGNFITSKSDNFKIKEEEPVDKYASVKIIKKISNNEPMVAMVAEDLSGFEFELWQDGERKYGPVVTNPDGEALFEEVLLGEYDIVELLTDEQKEIFMKPYKSYVNVDEENEVYVIEYTNIKKPPKPEWSKGKVIVTKFSFGLPQGKWNIRLPESPKDITFILEGENIETMESTTNKLGIATFDNLPEGTYTLKEIVPEGYESSLPDNGMEVVINKNRFFGIVGVTVNNLRIPKQPEDPWEGSIRIIKSMYSEELSPEGFSFELLKDGKKVTPTLPTDEYGEVQFNELEAGIYEVKEVDNEEYISEYPNGRFVEIGPELHSDTDYIAFVYVVNHPKDVPPPQWKGRIDVEKVVRDPRRNNPSLTGFEFELYKVEDGKEEFVERITTEEDGKISFKDLDEGIYKLYESNRAWYIKGIENSGRQIILSPNTAPERVLVITVTNTRYYPDDPDDDPDEPKRPREPKEPKEPEKPEEPVVVIEPVPEAQPEPEPVEEPIEEVVEEVPEAKPEPILPKTGAVNPLAYSGFGTVLLGLGLYLKKKEE